MDCGRFFGVVAFHVLIFVKLTESPLEEIDEPFDWGALRMVETDEAGEFDEMDETGFDRSSCFPLVLMKTRPKSSACWEAPTGWCELPLEPQKGRLTAGMIGAFAIAVIRTVEDL